MRIGDIVTFRRQFAGHGTRMVYKGEEPRGGLIRVVCEENGERYLVDRRDVQPYQPERQAATP
jgi:hypothetical protein